MRIVNVSEGERVVSAIRIGEDDEATAMATEMARTIPKQTVDKDRPCRLRLRRAGITASRGTRGTHGVERTGVYPGTFDPVTSGHMEVVRRSLRLVDRLVIGPCHQHRQGPAFSLEERIEIIKDDIADFAEADRLASRSCRSTAC